MKIKRLIVLLLLVFILLVVLPLIILSLVMPQCKAPISVNDITILKNGQPLIGNYYWVEFVGSYIGLNKIDNGHLELSEMPNLIKDTSLRVIETNREIDPNLLSDISLSLSIDGGYDYNKSEKALSKEHILEKLKNYSIVEEEYYEVKNLFHNNKYENYTVVIDLDGNRMISSSSHQNKNLWISCS